MDYLNMTNVYQQTIEDFQKYQTDSSDQQLRLFQQMKSTPKSNGLNYDSDEEDTNTNSFISKQESAANVQNINGQEYDVIDVGEQAVLVGSQMVQPQD